MVFDLNGPADGYRISSADHVYGQGRGQQLDVAGGAQLAVTHLANAYDIETGAQTFPYRVDHHMANVSGYRTLCDLVYGGSFEGYTTFGVRVRARLAFRVFTPAGPGTHSRPPTALAGPLESGPGRDRADWPSPRTSGQESN